MSILKKKEQVEKRPLGIYVHIPFCVKKCNYCDFLSAPATEEEQEKYVNALLREIRDYRPFVEAYCVKTVYFGGGTPSVLKISLLEQVITALEDTFQMHLHHALEQKENDKKSREKSKKNWQMFEGEMTIEVNPGTVTKEKLMEYQRLGFNRLSIGVQSAKEEELKLLGRIHSFQEAEQCVGWAREAGFANLNIDVISALPNQTLESYTDTLRKMIQLSPEHISSYSLLIEEGTPFYQSYAQGQPEHDKLPEEELDRSMYVATKELLEQAGYFRYEISNYAKPGFESRHNTSYWTGTEYLGLGLGAASLFTNARYHNETSLSDYIRKLEQKEDIRCDMERLVASEQMEEFMILGLRLMRGVTRSEFQKRFGCAIETIYGSALKKLIQEGLLFSDGDTLRLTEKGIDVSNRVFVEFVPESFVRR